MLPADAGGSGETPGAPRASRGPLSRLSLLAGRLAPALTGREADSGAVIFTGGAAMPLLGQLLVEACRSRDKKEVAAEYEALGADSPYAEDETMWRSHNAMMRDDKCSVADRHRDENRFCNILPFDAHLASTGRDGPYVNASVVSPLSQRFVIAQGPLERPDTREAFWRAALENQASLMVNLAPFPRECADYVTKGPYGEVAVEVVSETPDPHAGQSLVLRKLRVSTPNIEPAQIDHIQFNAWPNYGTPENLSLMAQVVMHALEAPGLVMVNCSGGVGRSGTLVTTLAVLAHLRQESLEGNLDRFLVHGGAEDNVAAFRSYLVVTVKDAIETIRNERHPWMVEGRAQYALIFGALEAVGRRLSSSSA